VCKNSSQCSVIKASRASAEGRGVLPESHAPDEVSLCVLLLQPPVGSQYSHWSQVLWLIYTVFWFHREPIHWFDRWKLVMTSHFCACSEELGEFMEGRGASIPGILTLTSGLSKPFMRLDKYPTLLKELERHMEVEERVFVWFLLRFLSSSMWHCRISLSGGSSRQDRNSEMYDSFQESLCEC